MIGRDSFAVQPQQAMSEARASTEVRSGAVGIQGIQLRNADTRNDTQAIVGSFSQEMDTLNSLFQNVGQGLNKWAEEKQYEQFMKGYFDASMGQSEKDLNESGGSFLGNLMYNDAEHAGARAYGVVANINNRVLDVVNNMDKYREMDPVTFRDTVAKSFQEHIPDSEDTIGRNAFMRHSMTVIPQLTTLQVASRKKWMDEETLRQQRSALASSNEVFDQSVIAWRNGNLSDEQLQEAFVSQSQTISALPMPVVAEYITANPPRTAQQGMIFRQAIKNMALNGADPELVSKANKAIDAAIKNDIEEIKNDPVVKAATANVVSAINQWGADSQQALEANQIVTNILSDRLGMDVETINQDSPGLISVGLTQEQINSGRTRVFTIQEQNIKKDYTTQQTQNTINLQTQIARLRVQFEGDDLGYQNALNALIPQVSTHDMAGNPVLSDEANEFALQRANIVIKEIESVTGRVQTQRLREIERNQQEQKSELEVNEIMSRGVTLTNGSPYNTEKNRETIGNRYIEGLRSGNPQQILLPAIHASQTVGEVPGFTAYQREFKGPVERAIRNPDATSQSDVEFFVTIANALNSTDPTVRRQAMEGFGRHNVDQEVQFAVNFAENFAQTRDSRQAAVYAAARQEVRSERIKIDDQQRVDILKRVDIEEEELPPQLFQFILNSAEVEASRGGKSAPTAASEKLQEALRGTALVGPGGSRVHIVRGLPAINNTSESENANLYQTIGKDLPVALDEETFRQAFVDLAYQKAKAAGMDEEIVDNAIEDRDTSIIFDGSRLRLATDGMPIVITDQDIRNHIEDKYRKRVEMKNAPGAGLLRFGSL